MSRPLVLGLCLNVLGWAATVPTPKAHLGYTPGDDYKLADYTDVSSYFHKLAATSQRLKLVEFGRSSEGRPMLVAFISSEANLARLSQIQEISRRMALGQASPEQAARLSTEGRAVVWIDSGLHASEVAPVQQSFDLAYRLVTGTDEETRRIRDHVVVMQVPVINPDGLDAVVHWYRKNVGTPYETAPLPQLYQKYAGHDNNRDYFMLNLPETRHVTRMLFEDWFPQIVYNQHQSPPFPARIFVPPYAEPQNPNIPATVMEGIHLIGSTMKERFAREGKSGVISYHGYDAWWNGGLRSAPAFHNMHGILTETAGYAYGTPHTYKAEDLPLRFGNGMPTRESSVFYQRPWKGGRWTVRDAIDYMLTADFAILDLASTRSAQFLYKAWETARHNIDIGMKGGPFAYAIPADQHDFSAALDMLERLRRSGIQVHRSKTPLTVGSRTFPAGSYFLLAGQPFRAYLVDLMEIQKYPELKTGENGPTKRPYDVAGWTLPLNMGVQVDRIDEPFTPDLELVGSVPPVAATADRRQNAFFLHLADALKQGDHPRITASATAEYEAYPVRTAIYQPYTANMDTGWTEYVLDNYHVPYSILHNEDFTRGDLRARFDSIIMASQTATSILHGVRAGEPSRGSDGGPRTLQRPEYSGGIGVEGLATLQKFVRSGGTLIALDQATTLPVQFFPLPLRNTAADSSYYCPGSILRIEVDPANPLAAGMPKDAYAFNSGGQAWEITLSKDANQGDRAVTSVVRYANSNVLASGWLSGERAIAGKHAMVRARYGKGSIVLFGFRPQFRAQSTGTYKLLLNVIYLASAKSLDSEN